MSEVSRALPRDPALPTLGELLDPAAMAPVLQRSLASPSPPEVRIHYLRYKPGTNLVVHYDVGVPSPWHHASAMIASRDFLARRARKPEHVRLARAVNGRSPAVVPLAHDPELGAMVQWLPLDIALPALAIPAAGLRSLLRSAGVRDADHEGEPALLAYKPRRRAVLRLGAHVLKLYAKEAEYERAAAGLRAASGPPRRVRTARFEAALPGPKLTVQRAVGGTEVGRDAGSARRAGEAVARLHGCELGGLRQAPQARQLEAAVASARLAKTIAPELAPRIARLVHRLAGSLPEAGPLLPSHGDFSPHQVLDAGGDPVLIDFDELCAAPAALDLATYAAYLARGEGGDREAADRATEALLDGYGRRPPGLHWYLASAILRRAPAPFRRQEEGWPDRVEAMIAAAEAALAR